MAKDRTNTLTITCSAITGIDLVQQSFQITSGQPFQSAGASGSAGVWTITVNCGRSGSKPIAQSYVSQAGGQYHMFVEPSFSGNSGTNSDVPQNMNFWFQANVQFGSDSLPLYFGQDGVGNSNYWWIGGPMILNSSPDSSPIAYLVSPGGALYEVAFVHGNVDEMTITAA